MSAITTATILRMVFFAKTAKIAKFTHPIYMIKTLIKHLSFWQ